MIRKVSGKPIHRYDCTWCKHRIVYPRKVLAKHEVEKCAVTGKLCGRPGTNDRWCEYYQQIGCDCESCTKYVKVVLQMELNLDKRG